MIRAASSGIRAHSPLFAPSVAARVVIALAALSGSGCGRGGPSARSIRLHVPVAADSSRPEWNGAARAGGVRVWMDRVRPAPARDTLRRLSPGESAAAGDSASRASGRRGDQANPAPARLADLPAPDAAPDSVPAPEAVPDPALRPPLLKSAPPLAVPARAGALEVELEVEVDESGAVREARWAGGSRDPECVRASLECAHAMRFYPALRSGRPVAVWCRQRFEFGAR
jgi:hypothetical protein